MPVDEFELRHAITQLKAAYFLLEESKDTIRRVQLARQQEPVFGPRSPIPDGDWALNLEDCLLNERLDDRIPGGLLSMTHDALTYTDAGDRVINPITGAMVCAHLWRNAGEICWKFPAAQELLDLLREQTAYLTKALRHLIEPAPDKPEAALTMKTVLQIVHEYGYELSESTVKTWAHRGKIGRYTRSDGRRGYMLSEIWKMLDQ